MDEFIRKAEFLYICEGCGKHIAEFSTPKFLVEMKGFPVLPNIVCNGCTDGSAKLVYGVYYLTDKYGFDSKGYWVCPRMCSASKYFPIPLRNEADRISKGYAAINQEHRRYRTVIRNGFPWKCPLCGTPLQYKETRLDWQQMSLLDG